MKNQSIAEVIASIKGEIDLVDLVSQSVDLRRRGKYYFGLCPFHKEKTPSFQVDPEGNNYHCYGCGAHGDAINFHAHVTGSTNSEAIIDLSVKHGIELSHLPKEDRDTLIQDRNKRQQLFYILQQVEQLYFNNLLIYPEAISYCRGRGISSSTQNKFRLGYAFGEEVVNLFIENNWDADLGVEAGILSCSDHSKRYYDFFRNRLIFPIKDKQGRTIAFGGRSLGSASDSSPKYINSRNTLLFQKKQALYGVDVFSSDSTLPSIIVEGYLDVIQLHENGISNVVAAMGLSPNKEEMRRLSDNWCIALDDDKAGAAARDRILEDFSHELGAGSLKLSVADLQGKDPDEFVANYSADSFLHVIKTSTPALEFDYNRFQQEASTLDLLDPFELQSLKTAAQALLSPLSLPEIHDAIARRIASDFGVHFPLKNTALVYSDFLADCRIVEEIESDAEKMYAFSELARRHKISVRRAEDIWALAKAETESIQPQSLEDLLDQHNYGREWIIPKFVPNKSTLLIYGEPNSGKTSFASTLAYKIAIGERFATAPYIRQGTVLFIQTDEPPTESAAKMQQKCQSTIDIPHIYYEGDWHFGKMLALENWLKDMKPVLIVIDSLTGANRGRNVDENSPKYGEPIRELNNLANQYNCSFIILHHSTKSREFPSARGTGDIKGACCEYLRYYEPDHNEFHPYRRNCRVILSEKQRSLAFCACRPKSLDWDKGVGYVVQNNSLTGEMDIIGTWDENQYRLKEVPEWLDPDHFGLADLAKRVYDFLVLQDQKVTCRQIAVAVLGSQYNNSEACQSDEYIALKTEVELLARTGVIGVEYTKGVDRYGQKYRRSEYFSLSKQDTGTMPLEDSETLVASTEQEKQQFVSIDASQFEDDDEEDF